MSLQKYKLLCCSCSALLLNTRTPCLQEDTHLTRFLFTFGEMFLCDERAQSTKTETTGFHEGGTLNTQSTLVLMHIIPCLLSLSALSVFSMMPIAQT